MNKISRACVLVHHNYYHDERVERYVKTLLENGCEVDVVCPYDPEAPGKAPIKNLKVIMIRSRHRTNAGFQLLWEYFIAFWQYLFVISRQMLRRRYQLVHVHNMPDFLVFSALLPKLMGAVILLDVHDPIPEFFISKFHKDNGSLASKLLRLEEKCSVQFCQGVIAANENFKINMVKRGVPAEKITVIRNFPDQAIFSRDKHPRKRSDGKIRLIYPGSIAPRYGLDVAIRGVALLTERYPQIELSIIGYESKHKQDLRDLSAHLNVQNKVHFLPAVLSHEVPALLASADIGIYPAIPDVHMDIAIPTKVLEFTAMRLPVLTSDLTVIRQLFPGNLAYTFPAGDVQSFADRLEYMILHPEEVERTMEIVELTLIPGWRWELEQQIYLGLLGSLSRLDIGDT